MVQALLYKEIKLMTKDNFIMLLVQLLFILSVVSLNSGIAGYTVMILGSVWSYLLSSVNKEKQYKARAYLLSSPINPKIIIGVKYLFVVVLFIGMTAFYGGFSMIMNQVNITIYQLLDSKIIAVSFLLCCAFFGTQLPLYELVSQSSIPIVSFLFIFVGFFIYTIVSKYSVTGWVITVWNQISPHFTVGCYVLGVISLFSSYCITIHWVEKQEY